MKNESNNESDYQILDKSGNILRLITYRNLAISVASMMNDKDDKAYMVYFPITKEIVWSLYELWIKENVKETYGKCEEKSKEMQKVFPELKLKKGHYICFAWGKREHWWLENNIGIIIDPTKDQFPSKGNCDYVELDESLPQPTGKCPNCGNYCYDNSFCCSEFCSIEYVSFCTGGSAI